MNKILDKLQEGIDAPFGVKKVFYTILSLVILYICAIIFSLPIFIWALTVSN